MCARKERAQKVYDEIKRKGTFRLFVFSHGNFLNSLLAHAQLSACKKMYLLVMVKNKLISSKGGFCLVLLIIRKMNKNDVAIK